MTIRIYDCLFCVGEIYYLDDVMDSRGELSQVLQNDTMFSSVVEQRDHPLTLIPEKIWSP